MPKNRAKRPREGSSTPSKHSPLSKREPQSDRKRRRIKRQKLQEQPIELACKKIVGTRKTNKKIQPLGKSCLIRSSLKFFVEQKHSGSTTFTKLLDAHKKDFDFINKTTLKQAWLALMSQLKQMGHIQLNNPNTTLVLQEKLRVDHQGGRGTVEQPYLLYVQDNFCKVLRERKVNGQSLSQVFAIASVAPLASERLNRARSVRSVPGAALAEAFDLSQTNRAAYNLTLPN